MAKTLKEIEKIVDNYEKELRKLDHVITYNAKDEEVNLNLSKNKGIITFLREFLYYNHLLLFESSPNSNPNLIFSYTKQIKSPGQTKSYKCHIRARRSIGDLFRLSLKYYSNDISLYDVMEAMYKIVQSGERISCKNNTNSGIVYMDICSTINRRVFNLDVSSSSRENFRFNSNNSKFTSTNYLTEEFFILGTDYELLFNTITGKDFVRKKRESNFTLQVTPQEELDRAVMEKLAKMQTKPMELKKSNRLTSVYSFLEDENLPF